MQSFLAESEMTRNEVSSLLQLPKLVFPVFGLCLGYPDQDPEVKPGLPISVVVKDEVYKEGGDGQAIIEPGSWVLTRFLSH